MKSIVLCILDNDPQYVKTFISVVAESHAGCSVITKSVCYGDCGEKVDACLCFEPFRGDGQETCGKALRPVCGKHAGVNAILREAKSFALDRGRSGETATRDSLMTGQGAYHPRGPLPAGALVCVYSLAGGAGTSVAAIGAGRELSRYRGERALYLSLEEIEDPCHYQENLGAMRAEETLYRYLRLQREGAPAGEFERLFEAAAACDEYGLYRLAPDESLCSLAGLPPSDLHCFLTEIFMALRLTRIVLDFGTRLYFLSAFAALLEDGEAVFAKVVCPRKAAGAGDGFLSSVNLFEAAFSRDEGCISLAGAFGSEIKELCDRLAGQAV